MLPIPPDPVNADRMEPDFPQPTSDQSVSPTQRLPQLFSDHERARSPLHEYLLPKNRHPYWEHQPHC